MPKDGSFGASELFTGVEKGFQKRYKEATVKIFRNAAAPFLLMNDINQSHSVPQLL